MKTQVQSLGGEDALDKEMATHSAILARTSHGQGSLAGYSPWGRKEVDMIERLGTHSFCLRSSIFRQSKESLEELDKFPQITMLIMSVVHWPFPLSLPGTW